MNGESSADDPLFITTRLLSDALTRLRIFVFGLDPMQWLSLRDRNCLYTSQICCLAILKSSVAVGKSIFQLELENYDDSVKRVNVNTNLISFVLDLDTAPMAYPLPYGEYLGEVEALHLILAHDLYTELRSIIGHVQVLLMKISISICTQNILKN